MTARVGLSPVLPSNVAVKVGRPVSGRDWSDIAAALNWCHGRGCTLVPFYNPGVSVDQGVSRVFRFKLWRRVQARARLWAIRMRRDPTSFGVGVDAWVTVTLPSGETQRIEVRYDVPRHPPFLLVETVSSPAAGIGDATLTIDVNATEANAVLVEGIGCYELPRAVLDADGTEYGVNVESCRPGEPMFDDEGVSVGGVGDSVKQLESRVMRGAVHVWSVPDEDALSTTSAVYTSVFDGNPRPLASKKYRADTTRTVTVAIRIAASTGTTSGQLRVTTRLGATVTLTIPASTSYSWVTGTVAIDAEDLTASDGRRSTAWESLAIEWRRTAGAGSLLISGFEIGDA